MGLATLLLVLVGLTFILRIVSEKWRHRQNAKRLGCQPAPMAPSKDPLAIGDILEIIQADKDKVVPELLESRTNIMRDNNAGRYVSTFRLKRGLGENLLTFDPENLQAMLAKQFKDFSVGGERLGCMGPLLGKGIFINDGAEWSHSRTMLRPQFTREQISDLGLEERHVQNAMRAIPAAGSNGWTEVDIQSIYFRLTLDSATELLFGESCYSQLAAMGDAEDRMASGGKVTDFGKNFDRAQWYMAQRLRLPRMKFLYDNKEFRTCCQEVHRFVDECVAKALHDHKKKKQQQQLLEEGASEHYIFVHAMAETTKDPIELRSQLLNVLLAGRDTTAALLSWTTLLLSRHPEVFHKLREAIIADFGTYENPQNITFATLKACTYLQQVMNETLRLFPPLPTNARYATKDTSLPRGGGPDGQSPVYIKKGQAVLYNVHMLHRREDVWGKDAKEFKPERWEARRSGWEYLPFNGGPRICIGQQFALTEAGYVLVRMLQRFDGIEDVHADQRIRWGLTLVSAPGDTVTVRLHEASR
ncbi:cytochrome P450 52A13 [Aspergillus awamori]|uniref:Cytochrome P450 52A13 n=3 Tax=Aspergillus TaxID=5052 RepID=A0A401L716_ASPAW|nr:cytochrome P450 alkane hydroxylase [Aspergillus niger ATCC 1015]KAI2831679.1 hypothetical protein CBS133816_2271 [Aspergillus niger]RDK40257.1 cytochrome P450 alkane hydroxylase [Aspergillus phoenicis ATCC 13157]GCB27306.1 cytochrome P450 52A13 [Aspergillus awamori]KAI2860796.1 hypothetical protein CBS12448_5074 [Aspergillus niger]